MPYDADTHTDAHTWVALRAKEGESNAVAQMSSAQIRRVQPLMILGQSPPSPSNQLAYADNAARHLRRNGRVLAVDAADTTPSAFGKGGALGSLVDRLKHPEDLFDAPTPIMPVVRSDTSARAAADLGRLGAETGTGVALRARCKSGRPFDLDPVISTVGIDPRSIDVVVDVGFVNTVSPEHVDAVFRTLDALESPVRSVVLMSGSIPSTFGKPGVWEQDRHEELLWQTISEQRREVHFGDYGVVHPGPGSTWRSKNVTIRYTCPARWWYGRTQISSADDEGDAGVHHAFRIASRDLVASGVFAGADFSWGDHELHEAANGRGSGLGKRSKPVAVATSHHLAYLAGMETAS